MSACVCIEFRTAKSVLADVGPVVKSVLTDVGPVGKVGSRRFWPMSDRSADRSAKSVLADVGPVSKVGSGRCRTGRKSVLKERGARKVQAPSRNVD